METKFKVGDKVLLTKPKYKRGDTLEWIPDMEAPVKEPQKPLLMPSSDDWGKVVEWLSKAGNTIGKIEAKRTLSIDDRNQLIKEAAELAKTNNK